MFQLFSWEAWASFQISHRELGLAYGPQLSAPGSDAAQTLQARQVPSASTVRVAL
jgi:hypothetical protein